MHHHFRSYVPFIKTPWVRSMSTSTFVYLMSVATKRYGDIPTGKGDDDGTIFSEFLRESRYPTEQKHVKWEEVRDILEKYKVSRLAKSPLLRCEAYSAIWSKFIPFCNKVALKSSQPRAHLTRFPGSYHDTVPTRPRDRAEVTPLSGRQWIYYGQQGFDFNLQPPTFF